MTAPALAGLVTLIVAPDAGPADLPGDLPPFVGAVAVDDLLLPTVREHAPGLPVTVVGTGGAAQVAGPLGLAARAGLVLAGVRTTLRDAADPAGNVRRVVAALDPLRDDGTLPEDVPVTVVLPTGVGGYGAEAALDEIGYADLVVGLDATRPEVWTALVDAALDREVATETVRGDRDPVAVLAAVRSCLDGEPDEAARLLAGSATAAWAAFDAATLERTRRWCRRVDVPAPQVADRVAASAAVTG
ncbi:hypothetical protein [Nocardioides zeae]|uniref:Rhodanese-related sulfurtransferase n=1 Tax=Nocardioides zeae TaxID=1457234 RepID=A0AAJ1U0P3_9ACTN|nr:hypothetical protein [Nocardioides zeae]MDQ1105224.1 rhodanese-related sulfurtransferase [Nocardioides zeae]